MRTLVIGAAIVDQMMLLERLPKSGEDVPCLKTKTVIGGCAYNVASTLRNLDSPHDLCVPIGTGMYADLITAALEKEGYPMLLHTDEMDNGYCLSLIEAGGERTFITVTGAEGHFKKEWFNAIDMSKYDSIYLAGYQVAGSSGKTITDFLAANNSAQLFFAPGPVITAIDSDIMNELLDLHPILHVNEKEAFDYTHEQTINAALKKLYDRTGNLVIVTLGAEGTAYYDGSKSDTVAPVKTDVVDTVGAGDSHIGAVIGCLERGLGIHRAVEIANIVASGIVGIQGPTITKEEFIRTIGGKINE